jgi:hypothetical protein
MGEVTEDALPRNNADLIDDGVGERFFFGVAFSDSFSFASETGVLFLSESLLKGEKVGVEM